MQSVRPVDIAMFHQHNIGVRTVVLGFEQTVIEAGVDHQHDVVEVE